MNRNNHQSLAINVRRSRLFSGFPIISAPRWMLTENTFQQGCFRAREPAVRWLVWLVGTARSGQPGFRAAAVLPRQPSQGAARASAESTQPRRSPRTHLRSH